MNRGEAKNKRIVLVTCPSVLLARKIARAVVGKRQAACVNIILSPVESVYTWKGKVERAREYLLVMKTTAKRLAELENEVKRLHSSMCRSLSRCRLPRARRNIFRGWGKASLRGPKIAN